MADTLKEFLVALGFKVDEHGLKRFELSVAGATKSALALGAAVSAAATEVELGVERVASRFEDLYYLSQRTGTTVSNIMALDYAGRQIGITSDQARGAVESLSRILRTQPGTEGLLNSLHVQTRDANHALLNMDDILVNLITRLHTMPTYLATQYAAIFGIDYTTYMQLNNNLEELKKRQAEQRKAMADAGIDADTLSSKFHDFMQDVRQMENQWETLATQIAKNWLPIADQVVHGLTDMAHWLTEVGRDTEGVSNIIGTLAVSALGTWIAKAVLLRTVVRGTIAEAGAVVAGAAGTGLLGLGAAVMLPMTLTGDTPRQPGDEAKRAEFFKKQRDTWEAAHPGQTYSWWKATKEGLFGGKPHMDAGTQDAIDYFISMGWSREQAAGIVANLFQESKLDPKAFKASENAVGIAQWHPDRQRAFRLWAGKDLKDASYQEQLAFVNYELTKGNERGAGARLRGAKTASEAGALVSRYYERPLLGDTEAAQRGAAAQKLLELNQTTTIVVQGGGSAQETAQSVKEAQKDVNAGLVRNFRPILQ